MNTLNHSATGASIAITLGNPAVALPLAFVSHFVLDALPHYGYPNNGGYVEALKHKKYILFSMGYETLGFLILIILLLGQSWLVWIAALVALSPDLKWPYRYWFFERKGQDPPEADVVTKFHQWVQWCERPWGIIAEIAFSVIILMTLWRFA